MAYPEDHLGSVVNVEFRCTYVKVGGDNPGYRVKVASEDKESSHFFMLASRATAEQQRDRALRTAAAWQYLLDEGAVR